VKHLKTFFSWIAASIQSNFHHGDSTGNSDVLAVLAVVDAPAAVWTFGNICLRTAASYIIQPDWSVTGRSA